MTFKKNLFVLLSSVFLAVVGALLMGIGIPNIIEGLTLVIPTVAMALLIEDLWRKLLGDREKLSWQYFFGELLIIASTLTWFWASTSVTIKDMVIRLITVFLFGVLGMLWFELAYKPSVQSIEEREQEKWEKYRTKIKKADKETAVKILANVLRYRLCDHSIASNLDTSSPLAVWDNQILTLEEVLAIEDEGNEALLQVKTDAIDYLQLITVDLPETREDI